MAMLNNQMVHVEPSNIGGSCPNLHTSSARFACKKNCKTWRRDSYAIIPGDGNSSKLCMTSSSGHVA